MRALVLDQGLSVDNGRPVPALKAGEALIRVIQAGICSTDQHILQGYMKFKGILGHEFVGVVERVEGSGELVGSRVAGEINVACRTCDTCLARRFTHCPHRTTIGIHGHDGAFADYLSLPLENLHPVPQAISDDQAVFIEPLAAACEIVQQVSIKPTDRVIVVGDGKLGLLCAQLLQMSGCHLTVLGHHPAKLSVLQHRGISTATNAQEVPSGADVIVEATGTPVGLTLARQFVRPRGTIVLKSTYHGQMQVDMTDLVVNEVTLIGSRCGPFEPAIRLLQNGFINIQPLIHGRYPIAQGLEAFQHSSTKGTLKVMIEMD